MHFYPAPRVSEFENRVSEGNLRVVGLRFPSLEIRNPRGLGVSAHPVRRAEAPSGPGHLLEFIFVKHPFNCSQI